MAHREQDCIFNAKTQWKTVGIVRKVFISKMSWFRRSETRFVILWVLVSNDNGKSLTIILFVCIKIYPKILVQFTEFCFSINHFNFIPVFQCYSFALICFCINY